MQPEKFLTRSLASEAASLLRPTLELAGRVARFRTLLARIVVSVAVVFR